MAEVKFRYAYTPIDRTRSDIGDREKVFYSLVRDDHNNCIYKERARVDIQQDIQSYKDSCSLEAQLLRMQFTPIHTVMQSLHQTEVVSGDFSILPRDLVELNEVLQRCKSNIPNFDTLVKNYNFNDLVKILTSGNVNSVSDGGNNNGENESGNE